MKTIPYSCQDINVDDISAVTQILQAPFLTQGPAVEQFEADFACLHGGGHAVAVCNATAALHIACLALDVGPGDWVWTSPNSFVASANCAIYCGANIGFVDIDPVTRNISVDDLAMRLAIADRKARLPKVVITVDFAGLPCDMQPIRELADRYGFKIISDSSHAVGATYNGSVIGGLADISVFSFHPVKIVTTGEGGLCLTGDGQLANRMRMLRSHGITRDPSEMDGEPDGGWYYQQTTLGFNYRLTDLQAALGSSQLKRLARNAARRDELAQRYDALLEALPVKRPVRLPDRQSAHHLYVVEVVDTKRRRSVFDAMRAEGILVNVHYAPIHLQPFYRARGFAVGDFPASETYYAGAISLPLYPHLTDSDQDFVVLSLRRALER